MDKSAIGIILILILNAMSNTICQGLSWVKGNPPNYSTDLESELRAKLFNGYEVLQRPAKTVSVFVALNMITINSLDIKDQTLSTSGYFSMKWKDSRLEWASDSNYTNIRFMFSNENYMWAPAVIVENSVRDISVISDTKTLMRINSNAFVYWTPGGIFHTNCEADVTYYPLDTQTCSIILSTWSYTSNEVQLQFNDDDSIVMTHFTENGEWEIIATSNSSTTGSREKESVSRLYFTFQLRRRPLFHILNTLFPVILMASLTIFVFKLPPESGERIGMSLTVLLAYAVYLTLISGNIPQTSTSASILSTHLIIILMMSALSVIFTFIVRDIYLKLDDDEENSKLKIAEYGNRADSDVESTHATYLTIILMMSALSVIFTIIVLDIYFNSDDDEEIPDWLQKFTRKVLVPVTCLNVTCFKRKQVSPMDNSTDILTKESLKPEKDINGFVDGIKGGTNLGSNKKEISDTKYGLKESENNTDEKVYKWKEIALLMDRCFLLVFILLVVIASVVCLALLVSAPA